MCSFNDFDVLALNPTGSAYVVPKSGDALVTDPHPDPLANVWHEGEFHPLEEPTTHSEWPAAVTRQQYDHARYLVTGFDSTMNVIIGTASGTVAVAEDHDPNGFCSGHANADIVWNLNGTIQSISFLESFASQMFGRRGTYGWNHTWAGDLYHVLMYAQLQPKVLYEESLPAGLDGVKVLVMADCDVLTKSVVDTIHKFQAAGGLVVGDAEVCRAVKPDFVIPRFARTKVADKDRQQLLATAKTLRGWLDERLSALFGFNKLRCCDPPTPVWNHGLSFSPSTTIASSEVMSADTVW